MSKRPLMKGMLGLVIATAWVAASLQGQSTGEEIAREAAARVQAAQALPPQAAAVAVLVAPVQPPQAAEAAAPDASSPAPAQGTARGRRDPFRPLVVPGAADRLPVCTRPGKGQLVVGQLTVQGIVRGIEAQWIAVVDNNSNRAFFLYVGDDLCNGSVRDITPDTLVIDERVTDQAGRTRTREVVKQLAPN